MTDPGAPAAAGGIKPETQFVEYQKCGLSPAYFIHSYCQVENKSPDVLDWVPFALWPEQRRVLGIFLSCLLVIILKARQLGLSWLVIAYALWLMLFRPGSQVLMFSRRDDEAMELLERLKGMHRHLPPWLQAAVTVDNEHEYTFGGLNSTCKSFPTTKNSGRSYTASLVIVDEADFIQWLKQLITAVKPTVDAGGQLILISTSDKEKPQSEFKRLFRRAMGGLSSYAPVFLPWAARPERTAEWYAQQAQDYDQDDLWQEYPETPEQALAQRTSRARFSPLWLHLIQDYAEPLDNKTVGAPAISGLIVYERPSALRQYLVAVDTCEGDPGSDPSPLTVFDTTTWAEVAHLHGRFEPSTLAGYAVQVAQFFRNAVICPERNNHGHAMILATEELIRAARPDKQPIMYINPFDNKPGWLSDVKRKTLALDNAATVFREGGCRIRTEATVLELGSIEAATGKAPEGETDDRAMTVVIGLAALRWPGQQPGAAMVVQY